MSKVVLRGILLAVIVAAGVGTAAWFWHTHHGAAESSTLVLYGNVDIRQVQLAFNGTERIADLLVQEGDRVHPGQLLGELDVRRLDLAVASAAAQAQSQREVLARLEAGTRPQEIKQDRANLVAAQVEARNAERTARRQQDLVAKNLTSGEQADDARAAADAAAARRDAAAEVLALALAGSRKEDIAAARATLASLQAQLALARRSRADAELYAPGKGIVQDRLLEPGDMASPERPVYTIALTDPLWVRAYVAEPDLGKVRLGMVASVSTDSFPGKRYPGWVGYISPTAEFTPKSVETTELRTQLVYQVRVFVCNPSGELRLGMPATVRIALDQPAAASPSPAQGHCG
jgi:HlyD family secretion protein